MVDMTNRPAIWSVLIKFIYRFPKHFSLLFFLVLIEGGVAMLSIVMLIPMADFVLDPALNNPNRITHIVLLGIAEVGFPVAFWTFGALFIIANFTKGLLEVAIRYAVLSVKYAVIGGLFNDALKTFFSARLGFFTGSGRGKILNTLGSELNIIGDTFGNLATLLSQIVQLLIYLLVPLWLNPKLTLATLGLAMTFAIPFLALSKLSYGLGKRNTETANKVLGNLTELLGAARLILSFGKQKKARGLFLESFISHVNATLRSQLLSAAVSKLYQPMAMMAVVIALGIFIGGGVMIPELVAIMWSLLAAMPILSAILHGNTNINIFIPSYEQLVELTKTAMEFKEDEDGLKFISLRNDIKIKNLNFSYPGRESTLVGINLTLRKGSMTAFVGGSGSGKSTLVDLLMGLHSYQSGDLLVDGTPLKNIQINSFRDKIGYVPQDPQLFNVSIRENLLWASEFANEQDLWTALNLANADKFVRDFPNGIDTIVGERGGLLSGGQRQRIALARALIKQPQLLILDEATSSLDSESEAAINLAIQNLCGNVTMLIVAHRLSVVSMADQVYVFEKGEIVEEGPFASLSSNPDSHLCRLLNIRHY